MHDTEWLAARFEDNRSRLRGVAYRMLGSLSEADDAVQETWLRLNRSDTDAVDNLNGWLTTVVARICLDMLRARKSRGEESLEDFTAGAEPGPEEQAVLADSVGLALLMVLETLTPQERVAFVLHDMFDVSFDQIGPIVGRSSVAARQLASRARRRVRGADTTANQNTARNRKIVDAFLAASRAGDFEGLIRLLAPNAVLHADPAVVRIGGEETVRGAAAVAQTFSGRARVAKLALIDGAIGAVWSVGGKPRVLFEFAIAEGKVAAISLVAQPERLAAARIEILAS